MKHATGRVIEAASNVAHRCISVTVNANVCTLRVINNMMLMSTKGSSHKQMHQGSNHRQMHQGSNQMHQGSSHRHRPR